MRENAWKRVLSLALTLALVLGLLPVGPGGGFTAQAAEGGDEVVAALYHYAGTEYNQEITTEGGVKITAYDATVAGGTPVELVFGTPSQLADRGTPIAQWTGFETAGTAPWTGAAPDGVNYRSRIVKVTFLTKVQPTSCASYFWGMSELREIVGMETYLDTSLATSMLNMFWSCQKLAAINTSAFDTSKVTSMAGMFGWCVVITELNVQNFDTSRCVDMSSMFAFCSNLSSLDISNFDTWNVRSFSNFVAYTAALDKGNVALTALDTARATQMTGFGRYYESASLADITTSLDLSSFDTTRCQDFSGAFDSTGRVTAIYASDAFRIDSQSLPKVKRTYWAALYQVKNIRGGNGTAGPDYNPVIDYFLPEREGSTQTGLFTYPYETHAVLVPIDGTDTYRLELRQAKALPLENGSYVRKYETVVAPGEIDLGYLEGKETPPWQTMTAYDKTKIAIFDFGYTNADGVRVEAIVRPKNLSGWFQGMSGLTTILNMKNLNTSAVEDFSHMFEGCSALTAIDTKYMNVLNALDMNSMFKGCSALTELELLNYYTRKVEPNKGAEEIRHAWDTALVTDMSHMFEGCVNLTTLVTKGIDRDGNNIAISTANVTNMEAMFKGCAKLDAPDLSMFNTLKVTNMNEMFRGMTGAKILDLNSFSTGGVTNMTNMFSDNPNLKVILTSGGFVTLGLADPSAVPMFTGDTALMGDNTNATAAMAGWNGYFTKGGQAAYALLYTDGSLIFQVGDQEDSRKTLVKKWTGFESAPINLSDSWVQPEYITQVKTVTFVDEIIPGSTAHWFDGGVNIIAIDYGKLNTGACTDMSYMFRNCSALTALNVAGLETGHVTDMSHMFDGMSSLRSLDVRNFQTSNVTDMSYMFAGLAQADQLSLIVGDSTTFSGYKEPFSFDTSNVTNMAHMFDGCAKLPSLSLQFFNTAKVENMEGMFQSMAKVTILDLEKFDTAKVTNMNAMFFGDGLLKTIYANKSFTAAGATGENMFAGCTGIQGFYGTKYDEAHVGKEYARPEIGSCREYQVTVEATEYRDAYQSDRTEWTVGTPGYFTEPVYNIYYEKYGDTGTPTMIVQRGNVAETDPPGTPEAEQKYKVMTLKNGKPAILRGASTNSSTYNATWGLASEKIASITSAKIVDLVRETSYASMFAGFSGMTKIDNIANLDTSECLRLDNFCVSTPVALDVSSFKTSKLQNLDATFRGAGEITGYEDWDVSNVTSMNCTFYGNKGATFFDGSRWQPVNNRTINYLTYSNNFATVDLTGWDASYLVNVGSAFSGAQLKTVYASSSFRFPDAVKGVSVFGFYTQLPGLISNTASDKYTAKYAHTGEGGYFTEKGVAQYRLDLDGTLTIGRDLTGENVKPFDELSTDTAKAPWDEIDETAVTKVVLADAFFPNTTAHWFDGMTNLTSIEGLDKVNTRNVTDMSYMFNNCKLLSKIDLSKFDTAKVEKMDSMFANTIADLDVGYLSTTSLKTASHMFDGAKGSKLNMVVDVKDKTTGAVTQAARFQGTLVTDMSYMFANTAAEVLDATQLRVTNAADMTGMFSGSHFKVLDLSGWDTRQTVSTLKVDDMFAGGAIGTVYRGDNFALPAGVKTPDLFRDNSPATDFAQPDVTVGGYTLDANKTCFFNAETVNGVQYPARTMTAAQAALESAGHGPNAVWDPDAKTLKLEDISVSGNNGPAIQFNVSEPVTVEVSGLRNSLGLSSPIPQGTAGNVSAKGQLTIRGSEAKAARLSVGGSTEVPGIAVTADGGKLAVEDVTLVVSGQPGLKVDGGGETTVDITRALLTTSGTQGVGLSEKADTARLNVTDSTWTHNGDQYLINGAPVGERKAGNEIVTIVRSSVTAANIGKFTNGVQLQAAGTNQLVIDDHSKVCITPANTSGADASDKQMIVLGSAGTGTTKLEVLNSSVLNAGGGTESPVALDGATAAVTVQSSDLAVTSNNEKSPAIIVPANAAVTTTDGATVTAASPVGSFGTADGRKTVTPSNTGATITEIQAAGAQLNNQKNTVTVKPAGEQPVEVKVSSVETKTDGTVVRSETTVDSNGALSAAGANGISAEHGSHVKVNTATQTTTTENGTSTTTSTASGTEFTASSKGATLATTGPDSGKVTGVDTDTPVTVSRTDGKGNTSSASVTVKDDGTGSGGTIGANGSVEVKENTQATVTTTTPSGTTTTATMTAGPGSSTTGTEPDGTTSGGIVPAPTPGSPEGTRPQVTVTTQKTDADGNVTATTTTTVTPADGATVSTSPSGGKLEVMPGQPVVTETTLPSTDGGKTTTTTTTTFTPTAPAEGETGAAVDLTTGSATVPAGTPVQTDVTTTTKNDDGSTVVKTDTTTVTSGGDMTLNTTTGGVTTQPGDKVTVETGGKTENKDNGGNVIGTPQTKDPVTTEITPPAGGSEGLEIDTTGKNDIVVPSGTEVTQTTTPEGSDPVTTTGTATGTGVVKPTQPGRDPVGTLEVSGMDEPASGETESSTKTLTTDKAPGVQVVLSRELIVDRFKSLNANEFRLSVTAKELGAASADVRSILTSAKKTTAGKVYDLNLLRNDVPVNQWNGDVTDPDALFPVTVRLPMSEEAKRADNLARYKIYCVNTLTRKLELMEDAKAVDGMWEFTATHFSIYAELKSADSAEVFGFKFVADKPEGHTAWNLADGDGESLSVTGMVYATAEKEQTIKGWRLTMNKPSQVEEITLTGAESGSVINRPEQYTWNNVDTVFHLTNAHPEVAAYCAPIAKATLTVPGFEAEKEKIEVEFLSGNVGVGTQTVYADPALEAKGSVTVYNLKITFSSGDQLIGNVQGASYVASARYQEAGLLEKKDGRYQAATEPELSLQNGFSLENSAKPWRRSDDPTVLKSFEEIAKDTSMTKSLTFVPGVIDNADTVSVTVKLGSEDVRFKDSSNTTYVGPVPKTYTYEQAIRDLAALVEVEDDGTKYDGLEWYIGGSPISEDTLKSTLPAEGVSLTVKPKIKADGLKVTVKGAENADFTPLTGDTDNGLKETDTSGTDHIYKATANKAIKFKVSNKADSSAVVNSVTYQVGSGVAIPIADTAKDEIVIDAAEVTGDITINIKTKEFITVTLEPGDNTSFISEGTTSKVYYAIPDQKGLYATPEDVRSAAKVTGVVTAGSLFRAADGWRLGMVPAGSSGSQVEVSWEKVADSAAAPILDLSDLTQYIFHESVTLRPAVTKTVKVTFAGPADANTGTVETTMTDGVMTVDSGTTYGDILKKAADALTVTPAPGYFDYQWTTDGTTPVDLTAAVSADVTLKPLFIQKNYNLSVNDVDGKVTYTVKVFDAGNDATPVKTETLPKDGDGGKVTTTQVPHRKKVTVEIKSSDTTAKLQSVGVNIGGQSVVSESDPAVLNPEEGAYTCTLAAEQVVGEINVFVRVANFVDVTLVVDEYQPEGSETKYQGGTLTGGGARYVKSYPVGAAITYDDFGITAKPGYQLDKDYTAEGQGTYNAFMAICGQPAKTEYSKEYHIRFVPGTFPITAVRPDADGQLELVGTLKKEDGGELKQVTYDPTAADANDVKFTLTPPAGEIVLEVAASVLPEGAETPVALTLDLDQKTGVYTLHGEDVTGAVTLNYKTVQGEFELIPGDIYDGAKREHQIAILKVPAKQSNVTYTLNTQNDSRYDGEDSRTIVLYWVEAYNGYAAQVRGEETSASLAAKLGSQPGEAITILPGNANGDDKVDETDAGIIHSVLNYLHGFDTAEAARNDPEHGKEVPDGLVVELTPYGRLALDANGDKRVNSSDIDMIVRRKTS